MKSEVTTGLYLDDLAIGQIFESESYVLDRRQLLEFSEAYDPQPFHMDDDAAQRTLFGGLAASGWQTAALTMRLMVAGGAPLAGGIIGAGAEIAWLRPVRPGDTLKVFSEVTEIIPSRSKPDRGMVTLRSETRNQHGQVVQVLTSKLVVGRRTETQE